MSRLIVNIQIKRKVGAQSGKGYHFIISRSKKYDVKRVKINIKFQKQKKRRLWGSNPRPRG